VAFLRSERRTSAQLRKSYRRSKAPQSPRGDYDPGRPPAHSRRRKPHDPKHLNPREGITTQRLRARCCGRSPPDPKHLNPREGITTVGGEPTAYQLHTHPKHLNPREGITTGQRRPHFPVVVVRESKAPQSPRGDYDRPETAPARPRSRDHPKHLNPREGITTADDPRCRWDSRLESKAPQSPRGDYDSQPARG
jgi:hypothetical protein